MGPAGALHWLSSHQLHPITVSTALGVLPAALLCEILCQARIGAWAIEKWRDR